MKQVFLFLILMAILFLVPAKCIAQKKKKKRCFCRKIVPDIGMTLTHWEITGPGLSTTDSNYSRFEPKEQMILGSNYTNWNVKQGGRIGVE